MKIFILGHKGMLGHMVFNTLSKVKNLNISTTEKRFPEFDKSLFYNQDFIINCIGAIPQRTNNFRFLAIFQLKTVFSGI